MDLAKNIGLVTGGLSLVAFIISAALYAYRAKIKGKQKLVESVPSRERAATINDIAQYLRIDTTGMSEDAKERIVFAQIKQKSRRELFMFILSLVVALMLAFIAVISIGGSEAKAETKEFSAVGDHVKVDCDRDGRSTVSYTADSGYHIQNVFANIYKESEVRNTRAFVVSNDGKTATAAATFSGKRKKFGLDCPTSGSAQVRIYGTIEKNKGWTALLYDKLISMFDIR